MSDNNNSVSKGSAIENALVSDTTSSSVPAEPTHHQVEEDHACCAKLICDRSKFIHEPSDTPQSPKSILKKTMEQKEGKNQRLLKDLGSDQSEQTVEREKFIHEPSHEHHETKSILRNKKYVRHDVPDEEVEKGQHFSARRLMCVDEQDHNVLLSGQEKAEALGPSLSSRHLRKGQTENLTENMLEKKPLSHSKIKSVDEEDKVEQGEEQDPTTIAESLRKLFRMTDFKLHSTRHMVKAKSESHVEGTEPTAGTATFGSRSLRNVGSSGEES